MRAVRQSALPCSSGTWPPRCCLVCFSEHRHAVVTPGTVHVWKLLVLCGLFIRLLLTPPSLFRCLVHTCHADHAEHRRLHVLRRLWDRKERRVLQGRFEKMRGGPNFFSGVWNVAPARPAYGTAHACMFVFFRSWFHQPLIVVREE